MLVGTVREIKNHEYRVGLTPESARELVAHGHEVMVETGAGEGIGSHDREYEAAGARIVSDAKTVFAEAEMVVKVKEPQPGETPLLRRGQVLFTYLHLAAERGLSLALLEKKVTGIAYETVQLGDGVLPLLTPMSEVAGRMAVQVKAQVGSKMAKKVGKALIAPPGTKQQKAIAPRRRRRFLLVHPRARTPIHA
mgnify:CR=1 FL=1